MSFVRKLETLRKMFFGPLQIKGEEEILKEIADSKKIIFATTHISGFDVQLAGLAVGKLLGIVNLVADADLVEGWVNVLYRLGGALGGEENLLPIHYGGKGRNKRNSFSPDDFMPIKERLGQEIPIVMAAYLERKKIWHLPNKGGIGAVYLHQIVPDSLLVPVAVDVLSQRPAAMEGFNLIKTAFLKPAVKIVFCQPLFFEKIKGIEEFADLFRKIRNKSILPPELSQYHQLRAKLNQCSDALMMELAKELPPCKQGVWQEKIIITR